LATSLPLPRVLAIILAGVAWCAARFQRGRFSFGLRLRARTSRNVGVLAARAPLAACGCAVIEADEIAQLVELLLSELARVANA
jgi:hypothetical protein